MNTRIELAVLRRMAPLLLLAAGVQLLGRLAGTGATPWSNERLVIAVYLTQVVHVLVALWLGTLPLGMLRGVTSPLASAPTPAEGSAETPDSRGGTIGPGWRVEMPGTVLLGFLPWLLDGFGTRSVLADTPSLALLTGAVPLAGSVLPSRGRFQPKRPTSASARRFHHRTRPGVRATKARRRAQRPIGRLGLLPRHVFWRCRGRGPVHRAA